jgi:hypothetical protein
MSGVAPQRADIYERDTRLTHPLMAPTVASSERQLTVAPPCDFTGTHIRALGH